VLIREGADVRLCGVRHVNGPNIYTWRPVAVARLELAELAGQETVAHPGFGERLLAALPGLAEHHCAAGQPGGFAAAMARGTYFGHVTEHVALELSCLAGREVNFGRTVWAGDGGVYDVITECPVDEPPDCPVPRDLMLLAMDVVSDVIAEREPRPGAALAAIAAAVEESRLGVSTAALARAARHRDIPVRRVGNLSLLRLGYGCHRRLVWAALTDQTSAVAVDIASDKLLTKQLLAGAGVPVPEGMVVRTAEAAADALATLGPPVVVKPRRGSQGGGVSVGITRPDQVELAFHRAGQRGQEVIVERYVAGTDYRVLVVDGRVAAAARLRPPAVTGDGVHHIQALVAAANDDPRRGAGHARELTAIELDSEALAYLAARGLHPGSIPAPGVVVTLRRNANLSTGGTSTDVTGEVHPAVAAMCCRAAAAVGLDVCGIDLRLPGISSPPPPGAGAVIELNASPGLRMHAAPSAGRARDVAGTIIDRLYPPGSAARIPVVSVTGTNGKTTTVRMIGHILSQAGLTVGMTTTDGVYTGGRLIRAGDCAGPLSAAMVLDDPAVEAAVLETARGGILRGGLGYDRADVAVVTNITADHLGVDGICGLDELAEVKALVAEAIRPGATLILNAQDPRAVALANRPAVRQMRPVIRYFSLDGRNPAVVGHRLSGGMTCELAGGQLVETRGGEQTALLAVADLPGAAGGAATHVVANALAAIAACRALGVSGKDIRRALATFGPAEANPGRGNVYRVAGRPVIVDYAHNPAALAAVGRLLLGAWGGDPVAAVTLPGDRRDDLVADSAAAIAAWFGRVVVYEDTDLRGRSPGQMTALISAALTARRPGITIATAGGPDEALRSALAMAGPGDPVLMVHEELEPVRASLAALGAVSDDRLGPSGGAGCAGALAGGSGDVPGHGLFPARIGMERRRGRGGHQALDPLGARRLADVVPDAVGVGVDVGGTVGGRLGGEHLVQRALDPPQVGHVAERDRDQRPAPVARVRQDVGVADQQHPGPRRPLVYRLQHRGHLGCGLVDRLPELVGAAGGVMVLAR
jgi:cyanophycin synthetase